MIQLCDTQLWINAVTKVISGRLPAPAKVNYYSTAQLQGNM